MVQPKQAADAKLLHRLSSQQANTGSHLCPGIDQRCSSLAVGSHREPLELLCLSLAGAAAAQRMQLARGKCMQLLLLLLLTVVCCVCPAGHQEAD